MYVPLDLDLFWSLALIIANKKLQKDQDLAERTNMSISNIMRLLDFALNHTFLKQEAIHYKQIFGCALGSPIRPVIVDLHWGKCHRHSSPPPLSGGFVTLTIVTRALERTKWMSFTSISIQLSPSIQFTLELEDTKRQAPPFLDTITTRRGTNLEGNV